jgi:SLOG in TRPM, prokaryote
VRSPSRVELADAGSASAVHVVEADELRAALDVLGLHPPRPTVVVVGGAAGLEKARMDRLRPVFAVGIAPVMEKYRAVGVDGGTRSGVMRLFGEARAATQAAFPLVGVVAAGLVKLPNEAASRHAETVLDRNHTHFVIVPGQRWGAESPWIARTATVLAGTAPSVTVLVNGGQIAYSDVQRSVETGRPVIVVAGSGRTADVFVGALAGAPADERAAALVKSGLIRSVPTDQPGVLAELLAAALGKAAAK